VTEMTFMFRWTR